MNQQTITPAERNKLIYKAVKNGVPKSSLGRIYQITPQRVGQIYNREVTRKVKARQKRESKANIMEAVTLRNALEPERTPLNKVRDARIAHGLTLADVSRVMGMKYYNYVNLEAGRTALKHSQALVLACLFDLPLREVGL
jgi:DNA-binding XRE family transcriptional regulator